MVGVILLAIIHHYGLYQEIASLNRVQKSYLHMRCKCAYDLSMKIGGSPHLCVCGWGLGREGPGPSSP